MEKKTMGQFISALRKANGLTQQEIADKLNVSNRAVSRWERDECAPDITLIAPLAELLGVTCDELLKGERITTKNERKVVVHVTSQVQHLVNQFVYRFKMLATILIILNIVISVLIIQHAFEQYYDIAILLLIAISVFLTFFLYYSYQSKIKNNQLVKDNLGEVEILHYKKTIYHFLTGIGMSVLYCMCNVYIAFKLGIGFMFPLRSLPFVLYLIFPGFVVLEYALKYLIFKEKVNRFHLVFTILQFIVPVLFIGIGLKTGLLGFVRYEMNKSVFIWSILCCLWFLVTTLYFKKRSSEIIELGVRNVFYWSIIIAVLGFLHVNLTAYEAKYFGMLSFQKVLDVFTRVIYSEGIKFMTCIMIIVCGVVYFLQYRLNQD